MDEIEKRYSNLDLKFRDPQYASKPPEEHEADLLSLCMVQNRNAESRDIIRSLTINHILMARTIRRLNTQNTVLVWLAIVIAVFSAVLQWRLYRMSENQSPSLRSSAFQTNAVSKGS